MTIKRWYSNSIVEVRVSPKDQDLALALLCQSGLSTVVVSKSKGALSLQAQIPRKKSSVPWGRILRRTERRFAVRRIFRSIRTRRVGRGGWVDAYEKFLRPFSLLASAAGEKSASLVIDPRGLRPKKPKTNTLFIKASLAFGTGSHPSTQLAAEKLRLALRRPRPASVLDMGCGTGILAMCAARWGAAPVFAVDNDPEAVKMSRLNFRNNRIRGVVLLKGLAGVHRKFDVLVANITAPALLEMHDALVRRLKRGGILILSGLIYRDVLSLLRGYRDLKFQGRKNRLGWAVLVFKKS